jgi:hypothetical protein
VEVAGAAVVAVVDAAFDELFSGAPSTSLNEVTKIFLTLTFEGMIFWA